MKLELKDVINLKCQPPNNPPHEELNEYEFKKPPNYQYINLTNLAIEHKLFSDYDYEIIERNFCSYLVKIRPMTFPRHVDYQHPQYYYKRIYIDNSCEPPMNEQTFQQYKDYY